MKCSVEKGTMHIQQQKGAITRDGLARQKTMEQTRHDAAKA